MNQRHQEPLRGGARDSSHSCLMIYLWGCGISSKYMSKSGCRCVGFESDAQHKHLF